MMSLGLLFLPQLPSRFPAFLPGSPSPLVLWTSSGRSRGGARFTAILSAFTPSHEALGKERCSLQVTSWEGIRSITCQLLDPVPHMGAGHYNVLAFTQETSELQVSGARVLMCTYVLQGILPPAFWFCSAIGSLERKLGGWISVDCSSLLSGRSRGRQTG